MKFKLHKARHTLGLAVLIFVGIAGKGFGALDISYLYPTSKNTIKPIALERIKKAFNIHTSILTAEERKAYFYQTLLESYTQVSNKAAECENIATVIGAGALGIDLPQLYSDYDIARENLRQTVELAHNLTALLIASYPSSNHQNIFKWEESRHEFFKTKDKSFPSTRRRQFAAQEEVWRQLGEKYRELRDLAQPLL